ncbi:low temperature requirement protein A [Catenulispora yoronensis]
MAHPRREGRNRPWAVFASATGTAVLLALSTIEAPSMRPMLWIAGLACESLAAIIIARSRGVSAPGHLAARYGFIVIIGLDMSLGGMGRQMSGETIGTAQLLLVGLAMVACTIMWWLYFDALDRYGEHHLRQRTARNTAAPPRRRFDAVVHLHYNVLHLVALAGMISFAYGLRTIAGSLGRPGIGTWGPKMTVLWAVALCAGLALYAIAVAGMWALLHRKSFIPAMLAAIGLMVAAPFVAGLPSLPALAALTAAASILLLLEVLPAASAGGAVTCTGSWGRSRPPSSARRVARRQCAPWSGPASASQVHQPHK